MKDLGFYKFVLPLERNLFGELARSVDFEDVTKGRVGNHLVALDEEGVPLVRTTTKYTKPAHNFSAIHHEIVKSIQNVADKSGEVQFPSLSFNNALIEIYDQAYTKMKYHSDQCLDLDVDSYIALFSCYEHPEDTATPRLRKLRVRSKITDEESVFVLENNSVILFSLETNTQFQHKIVLDSAPNPQSGNRWLGITFRKSKTLIRFRDGLPYFSDGSLLKLADEAQRKEFYRLRGQENKRMDFTYPAITYTLSVGDTMVPKSG